MSVRCRAVCVLTFAAAAAAPALGQSMHSLDALAQGAALSTQYQGQTLWLTRDVATGGGFVTQHASAIRLNEHWGIAPGHMFVRNGLQLSGWRIGNGSNWMTNPGETRTVTNFTVHPLWDGSFEGQEVDLAVFRWDQALAGPSINIAPSSLGQSLRIVGFGRPATPALGLLAPDGQRRAFEGLVDTYGDLFGSISANYITTVFRELNLGGTPLGGVATGGNSGSGVYTLSGDLVGMAVAATPSPQYGSATYSLRLDLYQPWIAATIPTPGAASVLALAGLLAARRRR